MNNITRFWALLKQLPHADKEALVLAYSDNKTASLRDFLTDDPRGFSYMLIAMQNEVNKLKKDKPKMVSKDDVEKRRFRSLILRAMQDQVVMVRGGDWSEVNEFVVKYAGFGKTLSNMTLDELKKLNRQVHKLLEWHNNKKEIAVRLAIMN